ncbi:MAG: hypothetical protein HYV07_31565 [Deltaproteobacteria bacterium]|nr:hypothetical protein [Deltaproteobacteria bacterium]
MTAEHPSVPPPEASPRRKHRVARWLALPFVALLVLLLALVGAIVFLPSLYSPERLRARAEAELSALTRARVTIRELDYDLLSGVRIDGLSVGPPRGFTRPIVVLERLVVRWNLSGLPDREVVLEELTLAKPRLVLETVAGRTGLEVLLEGMKVSNAAEPAAPEPPPEPSTGPVSPIRALIRKVAIEDLGVELVGGSPELELTGVGLRLGAAIDPAKLTASLGVSTSSDARLSARVAGADGLMTSLEGAPIFSFSSTVAADASNGLVLERAFVRLDVGGRRLLISGPFDAPEVDVLVSLGAEANLVDDRLLVKPVRAVFAGETLIEAEAALDGISSALAAALGTKASSLAALLGARRRGPGEVRLDVSGARWDLSALWPYGAPFIPGARLEGAVSIGPAHVEGTISRLLRRDPRTLDAKLGLEAISFLWPSRAIALGKLDASFDAKRGPHEYSVGAGVLLRDGAFEAQSVGAAKVRVDASVQALDPVRLGTTTATIGVHVAGISTPEVKIGEVDATLRARGRDVLDPSRPMNEPVEALAKVTIDRVVARTGTTSATVEGLAVGLWAELDRVLEPARQPIRARVDVEVGRAEASGARISGLSAHVGATTVDPRAMKPIDADLNLAATLRAAERGGIEVTDAHVALAARAEGQALACPGCTTAEWAPTRLTSSLFVGVPKVRVEDPSLGIFSTSAKLEASLELTEKANELRVEKLRASLGDALSVAVSGRVGRPLSGPRIAKLRVELLPAELDALVRMVPPAFLAELPGLSARGRVGLVVALDGDVGRAGELAKLPEAPPLLVDARLALDAVSASLPTRGLEVDALTGTVAVDLARGRARFGTKLAVRRLSFAEGGAQDAEAELQAGIEAGELQLDLHAGAGAVGAGAGSEMKGSTIDVSLRYPRHGEPTLERFEVRAPASGIMAHAEGRLRRARFGALRPELELDARLDFDKLKKAVVGLDALSGELGAKVQLASTDRLLDLRGSIDLHRLGYVDRSQELTVSGSEGRIPFAQRVVLPPPAQLDVTTPGAFGDDLEARIYQLIEALSTGSRAFIDPDDALAAGKRSADYEALRPYDGKSAPRLFIDEIAYGRERIRAISMDPSYRSGVIRLDRFAMQIWDGDIFGHLAAQVTERGRIRFGIRGSVTDLDLDVPYAAAYGVPRAKEAELYRVSGILDLSIDEVERTIGGTFELTKMSPQMVIRLLKVLDPHGENPSIQRSVGPLEAVLEVGALDILGERLSGVTVTIRQNLMSMSLHWDKHLIGLAWGAVPQLWLPALRVLQAVVGAGAKLFDTKFPLGIADVVPDVRRLPVAQVYPVWETLEQKLAAQRSNLVGRLTSSIPENADDDTRAER